MFFTVFAHLSSFFVRVICTLPIFSKKTKTFLEKRDIQSFDWSSFQTKRQHHDSCYFFFCSSAGEYEQALPFISLLEEKNPSLLIHVFFFSPSGINFLKAKKAVRSYSLAPIEDLSVWQKFFDIFKPTCSVVVRHELWPAFIYEAKKHGPLYLINGTVYSGTRSEGFFGRILKAYLLRQFDQIFVVSGEDKQIFCHAYNLKEPRVLAVGDTKYDRALALVSEEWKGVDQEEFLSKPLFILGSAWPKDVELCLKAFDLRKGPSFSESHMMIVPHEPKEDFLQSIEEQCQKFRFSYLRYSEWQKQILHNHQKNWDVLIVDQIGLLSQLYRFGTWAFVGGGLHHKVHNVLEPATYGLPLAFGYLYKNSPEAVRLVQMGVARVVRRPEDLLGFWQGADTAKTLGQNTLLSIKPLAGATKRILDFLLLGTKSKYDET